MKEDVLLRIPDFERIPVLDVQVLHDGPQHRILRVTMDHDRHGQVLTVASAMMRCAAAYVTVEAGDVTFTTMRVAVPERFHGEDGAYFIAAYIDGRQVNIIIAREDWQKFASDRPTRVGRSFMGEVWSEDVAT